MITKKWQLGVQGILHDKKAYAVMCDDVVLVECNTDKELAEHIIDLHNKVYYDNMALAKGIHYCDAHGGFGFVSDCRVCNGNT